MIKKQECVAMLLAGGQGSRLYALTAKVAKPSIPFGGKYRIIDFPLSNCANSGIDTVGVLTQYQPLLLNRYIGSGQAWDLDSVGGVYILPPYQSAGERGSWFSGTANAIYQNMDFIEMYDPDCVLILSGDHVYKMDYDKMLRAHEQAGAACTISVIQVSMEEASRFGIMNVGPDGFINEFEEKPAHPKSDLASMGIYIFDWKALRRYLIEDEADPDSDKDFGKNIIPKMLAAGEKLLPYRFEGYWRDVGTIVSLWDANMDMLSPTLINLYDPKWPIRAKSPIRRTASAGRRRSCTRSSPRAARSRAMWKTPCSRAPSLSARARACTTASCPPALSLSRARAVYRPIRMSNVWPKSLAFIRFMSWQTKYATKKMRHSYRTVSPRRIFWAWSTTTRKLWKRTGKVRLHMITARLQ